MQCASHSHVLPVMNSANLDYQVELLTSMLDASPAAICVVDSKELRIKWVNRKYMEYLDAKFRSFDVTGMLLSEVFPGFFSSGVWAIYKEAARTATPFHDSEYRLEDPERGASYWHWSLTPLKNNSDGIDLMSQAIEVTHLVEARKKIHEQAEEILRQRRIHETMLAATPDFYYLTDPQGVLTFVNNALAEFQGLTVEHMLGKTFLQLGYPYDIAKEIQKKISQAARTRQIQKFESYYISLRGEPAYLDRWFVPILNERNETELVAGIVHNITDRKYAEEQLQESEKRFKLFVDAIPQLAWMANPDGTIYWYNQQWFDYTGTTLEEMAGWGWKSIPDPEYLPRVLKAWEYSLAKGEPFRMEFPLRGKDGKYRPFLVTATPYKNEKGEIKVWFGTSTRLGETERRSRKRV